jgi:hypothetical protein
MVTAVFDNHLDEYRPNAREKPLIGSGKIVDTVIKNLHGESVYPVFGSPEVCFFAKPLFKQKHDPHYNWATNPFAKSGDHDFWHRFYGEPLTLSAIAPEVFDRIHVCADAFDLDVWNSAAKPCGEENYERWLDNPVPPVFGSEPSTLAFDNLDYYIKNGRNLRQIGFYHAQLRGERDGKTESVIEYNCQLIKDTNKRIGVVAKRMLDSWSESCNGNPEIMICYSSHTGNWNGTLEDIEKFYGKHMESLDYSKGVLEVLGCEATTVIRSPNGLDVRYPDGTEKDITHIKNRINFVKENDQKQLFVVADDHAFANLNMLFYY